jgi:hypothetical protein
MVNQSGTGLGTNDKKDADVGLENRTKGVEEPTMGVDLLLILLLICTGTNIT